MKVLLTIAGSLVIGACQSKSTSASSPNTPAVAVTSQTEAVQTGKKDTSAVILDAVEQQKAHIVVESVGLKDMATTLSVPGQLTVSENQTWRVGAIAGGRVDEVSAHLGDFVRVGQILGRIHSHDVHEARAGYQQAQIEL